jgi:hypothetical protein
MPAVIRYSLPELKQMMKDNKIRGFTTMNKPDILKLLNEKGLVQDDALVQQEKLVKEVSPKHEFTKSIRCNPKTVIIKDVETGLETKYPSLYRASRTLGCSVKGITGNNGKVWKEKFEITIL